jgi:probable HAF family extracellular repeat protein
VNAAEQIAVFSSDFSDGHGLLCDNKKGVSIDLGNLGGPWTYPNAINARGQVVGLSETADEQTHAFLWDHGVMTDLGSLPGDDHSEAHAISDAGHVVGESSRSYPEGLPHAFLWKNSRMVGLGTLPGKTWSVATGINARGQVVGTSGNASANPQMPRVNTRGFLWQDGRMTPLPTLGGAESYAKDINAAGQIAGGAQTTSGEWHAVIWQKGTVTDLGPGGATLINNGGVVVGRDGSETVYWRNGVKVVLAQDDEDEDGVSYFARGINSSGVVVGERLQRTSYIPVVWTTR